MAVARQIFDYLPGIWRLVRNTTTPLERWQNSGAECIKANGFAAFTRSDDDPNLLIYSEKVIIDNTIDGGLMHGMTAKQKYKYRYDSDASTLTKYFFDDRLFYKLDFNDVKQTDGEHDEITMGASGKTISTACGEHLCIQDLYYANYLFKNDHCFVMTYTIRGPKKCYDIVNKYEKINPNELDEHFIKIENGEIV